MKAAQHRLLQAWLCSAVLLTDADLNVFDDFFVSKQLSVVAGNTDIAIKEDNEPVSKILPHPDYRCRKKSNDVALLKTARQLRWSSNLRPACLPQPVAEDFSGTSATGSKVKVIGTQMCAGFEDGGRDSCWVSDS
ncbi:Serine protease H42 [Operophtera brumata]|uniref:Serine protease H42 n=1 Tax=Operophtera brumata TaxID=104452 RepID=A0A0L7L5D5_OPEBR|nr:Serine protease H42 [Operophtera brumata]